MKKWFYDNGVGSLVVIIYVLFYVGYIWLGINNPQPQTEYDEYPQEVKNRFGQ